MQSSLNTKKKTFTFYVRPAKQSRRVMASIKYFPVMKTPFLFTIELIENKIEVYYILAVY